MIRSLFLLLLLTSFNWGFGQATSLLELSESNPDSVFQVAQKNLLNATSDVEKAKAYHILGWSDYHLGSVDNGLSYFLKEAAVYENFSDSHADVKARNLLALANAYYGSGQLLPADSVLIIAQSLFPQLNDEGLKIDILLESGWVTREQGRHLDALDAYLKGLDIAISNKDGARIADANIKIGVVYHVMGDYPKTKEYYDKALISFQTLDLDIREARLYNNYGLYYQEINQPTKAIAFFEKSIEMNDTLGNPRGVAIATENIGLLCFEEFENNTLALQQFDKSLKIWRAEEDIYSQAITLGYKNNVYLAQKKFNYVVDTGHHVLDLSLASGSKSVQIEALRQLAYGYHGLDKDNIAFQYFEQHHNLKDTLSQLNDFDEIKLMGQRFEIKQAHVKDSLELVIQHQQVQAGLETKNRRQRFISIILLIGFTALILIVFLLFKSRKERQKSAAIIERANKELQSKNDAIIDSINYAKRIQASILPTKKDMYACFPDHFVLYQPKDIVAGDFYWLSAAGENGTDSTFLAAADCTGHGVPGAMVSIVCEGALRKAINEFHLTDPAEILESVSKIVQSHFDQGDLEINDGMDICLIAVKETKDGYDIHYAGANNPLWIIRSGQDIVEELKPTKRPIGRYINPIPFQTKKTHIKKGDSVYLFSDGYADQFGGMKGKKYKYSALKKLFLSNAHLPVHKQEYVYAQELENWRGDIEQIDDICVIGVQFN